VASDVVLSGTERRCPAIHAAASAARTPPPALHDALPVFTDETALARFAEQRGMTERPLDYAALLGARIVDEIVPGLGEPAGLAVDIATEDGSMFFPPVTGIVDRKSVV